MSLKIIGTGHCVPQKNVKNSDLEKFLETSDEWIVSRTGIEGRNICTDESLCDIASKAAADAIQKAEINTDDIDLIICSTIQGDFITPSLACMVQKKFGLSCPAFDVNAACSGFIYALDIADGYISSGKAENILIISAEMMSRVSDWEDRSTCVLFGDGAGACVVTKGDALKYIHLTSKGDSEILYIPINSGNSPFSEGTADKSYLAMNGQEVFKFAVSAIESETAAALKKLNIEPDKIDYYLLHQANKRIIDFARSRLNQPKEKFPMNIESHGNTSSASIPILLDEMANENKLKNGDLLLFSAFGAGLTTGTCVIRWDINK